MVIVSLGDIAINENYLVLYVKRIDMNIYGTLKGFLDISLKKIYTFFEGAIHVMS